METLTSTDELVGTFTLDPAHSTLGFVARHAMISKVRGHFDEFTGQGSLDANGAGRIEVEITTASITTANADRDAHLASADFFDAENHPKLTFTSTDVSRTPEGLHIVGQLTIRGVSKEIEFDLDYTGAATDPWGSRRVGLEGSTQVSRKDWGLTWNAALEAGGVLVSDKVTLEFELSLVRN